MYYSLPITWSARNGKYKSGRRRTTNLNYPKNYIHEKENPKTLLKTPPLELWKSQDIYSRKGNQGECTELRVKTRESVRSRSSNLDARLHTRATETWLWPRFHCHNVVGCAPPPVTCYHFVPLSAILPGFWIWAPDFDRFTLQSQWLYV